MAGFIGHKIFLIGVRDFIHIIPNVYTNIADITQWIGFFIFTYAIFKNADQIWHGSSKRKITLVNPKEQIMFSLIFSGLVLLVSLAYIFSTLSFFKLINIANEKKELFIIISSSLTLLTLLSTFTFSIFLSARIWGPIFSFKRHINDQHEHLFKTRKTDFFKDLNQSLSDKNQETK